MFKLEVVETVKEKPHPSSLIAQELSNYYRSGVKKMIREELVEHRREEAVACLNSRRFSTEEVIRVAGAKYIQFSTQRREEYFMFKLPFNPTLSVLTVEECNEVELAHLLLASAEKVGLQQFDQAIKLLAQCDFLSSRTGTPVQRVVYHFAAALRERIDRQTGRIRPKELQKVFDVEEAMMTPQPTLVLLQQILPFANVTQFAGIQAIVENAGSATKVHLIDLGIKSGTPWTVLMQAFASSRGSLLDLLKITFVGTKCREKIEDTRKRLASFAQSMGLPFSFNIVMLSDMNDLREDLFDIKNNEFLAIYAPLVLRNMLYQPDRLETLMTVIRKLKPCIMVVAEVEANHNSPSFVNRFIESLFFYGTFFDCLEACMDRANHDRMVAEAIYLGEGIRNTVIFEGHERTVRNVRIDVWRAFFARFGLVETELSESSLYQASLVLKQFPIGRFCTLEMNGKCLLAGWKGTPIHSLSVWKFQ
ncbi:hypothetical protein Syun_028700 [Stephania yunnanensis]|uniref:DELLA protein RGL1 n=1 Tax=Stephania yunnanensis TaxID=152371 RepID=A0AAP0E473_9MAGN